MGDQDYCSCSKDSANDHLMIGFISEFSFPFSFDIFVKACVTLQLTLDASLFKIHYVAFHH